MICATNGFWRPFPGVLILCTIVWLVSACEQKQQRPDQPPPKVTISRPIRRNIINYLEYTGNTQAVNSVQLDARVEGYLEKVFFEDGDFVEKGQLLFRIQQNTYTARLKQAEGNVMAQRALLNHAQIEFARYSELFKQKAAAQTDVENWHYQVNSAQAALAIAEAQLDQARLELDYTSVTAPFRGRIGRRLVDPGALVGPSTGSAATAGTGVSANTQAAGVGAQTGGGTVLARLTQLDPIYVYFNVNETDVSSLLGKSGLNPDPANGSRYPVYMGLAGEEGYPHKGHLDYIDTRVSATTGTLLMRGEFPNPDAGMLPGQYARVRVPAGRERPAILVPKAAVGFDQLGPYVMVVNGQNTVERRNVKTGASRENLYVIENGLTGNEQVIVKGVIRAAPGRRVTPVPEAAEQPPSDGTPAENSGKGQSK